MFSRLAGSLVLLVGAGAPESGTALAFRVDASASRVTIQVGKAGLFKFAGHEHEVSALGFSGDVVAHPADLSRSSVRLTFEAAALKVTGSGEPPEDLPKVQEAMSGPRVLDVARFPEMRFDSRKVGGRRTPEGSWEIEVTGDFRLRAETRSLTLPMRVQLAGDTLTATGRVTIRHSDFGLEPISVAGVVKVKNELVIEYRIVARRTP